MSEAKPEQEEPKEPVLKKGKPKLSILTRILEEAPVEEKTE